MADISNVPLWQLVAYALFVLFLSDFIAHWVHERKARNG